MEGFTLGVISLLQTGIKPREPRMRVFLFARMRWDGGWADVHVHNVAAHGMLVAAEEAPKPGSYLDIRLGPNTIIGRAIWRKGRYFGVRTQDRIDLDALTRDSHSAYEPRTRHAAALFERRTVRRFSREAAAAEHAERSRRIASHLQLALVASAGIAGAALAAWQAHDLLVRPAAAIEAALNPGR